MTIHRRRTQFVGLILMLLVMSLWGTQVAANDVQEIDTKRWHVNLALGYGQLDNPRFKSEPIRSLVLPSVSYYGDRFYLENLTLGYSLYESDQVIIDLQTHLNEDGLLFELKGLGNVLLSDLLGYAPINDPFEEPNYADVERNISYLAGIYMELPTPWVTASLGAYQDISGVHHGHEVLFKLNRRFEYEHFATAVELGWAYKSSELSRYYYEIGPAEVHQESDRFRQYSGINSYARGILNLPLNPSWSLVAILEYNRIDSGIARSPLLDKQHYWGGFLGFSYAF